MLSIYIALIFTGCTWAWCAYRTKKVSDVIVSVSLSTAGIVGILLGGVL